MNYIMQTINKAKKDEERAIEIFEQNGWNVEDLRNIYEYQRKDIDFRVYNDQYSYFVEIKGSPRTETTGNVTVEFSSKNTRGEVGWFDYCQADYVGYVFYDAIHLVSFEDLKDAASSATRCPVSDGVIGLISVPTLEKEPSYRVMEGK